jgi:uncharacterized protein (DUF1778 family)
MTTKVTKRDRRIEVRTTVEERELIDRAVSYVGTDLSSFAVSNLVEVSRRVLADRDQFVLSPGAAKAWEKINNAPALDLPGLRKLMRRSTPFAD